MTRCCAALTEQRSWRDLRQIEQAVPQVRWVAAEEAATAPEPLVACGLWASREPGAAQVLRRRAAAGLAALLVARFEPGDLGPVIGAPVGVHIRAGETGALTWEDGRRYAVPGVTLIETPLPQGHWARSTAGTGVLAYRPHTQAGLIVLCTATVAGRALGADPAEQGALLGRLLDEIARRAPPRPQAQGSGQSAPVCAHAAEYLDRYGADGALVLLAALGTADGRVDAAALAALGTALPGERLAGLVAARPVTTRRDLEQALQAAGWGAHLRALIRRPSEAP